MASVVEYTTGSFDESFNAPPKNAFSVSSVGKFAGGFTELELEELELELGFGFVFIK